MELSETSRIVSQTEELTNLAGVLAEEIKAVTKMELEIVEGRPERGDIFLRLTTNPKVTGEKHQVEVDEFAVVKGANYDAVALGTTSLLQAIRKDGDAWRIPQFKMTDWPDVDYRSFMVDVARQDHSLKNLKELVKMVRFYKLRYLHVHFTDDQAFTFPSTAYPALSEKSRFSYTLEELKDLEDFARKRGIAIVPEIDLPAHSSAIVQAMPELFGNYGGLVDFSQPKVWDALQTIIGEMCDVFEKTPYFHLGADEANLNGVANEPQFLAAYKKYDVDGVGGLFNFFISKLSETVKERGKTPIAWEGFHAGGKGNSKMDTDLCVMMFDNAKFPQDYIDNGHRVINSSWFPIYIVGFDGLGYGNDPDVIYSWDRFKYWGLLNYPKSPDRRAPPKNVDPAAGKNEAMVIGASMCSWEMFEHREIDRARFRVAPYAERIWNYKMKRPFDDFHQRYLPNDQRLDELLSEFRSPDVPKHVAASDEVYPDKVRVGWADGGNFAQAYDVYRSTGEEFSSADLVAEDVPKTIDFYDDLTAEEGRTYSYWLKAKNMWGESEASPAVKGRVGKQKLPQAHEPFDYEEGVDIDGLDGGTGFAKPWKIHKRAGTSNVIPEGLSYPGLATSGGAVKVDCTGSPNGVETVFSRNYGDSIGRDLSEVWVSYLVKPERVGNGWFRFDANRGGLFVQKETYNGIGIHYDTRVFMESDTTYFFLVQYDCRPGHDNVNLWINPDLSKKPSADDVSAHWAFSDIGVGDELHWSIAGWMEGIYIIDEIRLGHSFSEVIGK